MEARKIGYYELKDILDDHRRWENNPRTGKQANFKGLDLTEFHLEFTGMNLFGVDFSYSNLAGADLCGCNLDKANFTGANLSNADLCGAWLMNAKVKDADFTGADFYKAWVSGTNWSEAKGVANSNNFSKVRLAQWNKHPHFESLTIQEQIKHVTDKINVIKL